METTRFDLDNVLERIGGRYCNINIHKFNNLLYFKNSLKTNIRWIDVNTRIIRRKKKEIKAMDDPVL